MRTQLFIGRTAPHASRFEPVTNTDRSILCKPTGGLWTSTWQPKWQTSGWVEWCRHEWPSWLEGRVWALLTPPADARIARVDTLADLRALHTRYGYLPDALARAGISHDWYRALDFARMATDGYDGIHLTERGQWATHLSEPNLYGWDCECTLWLRWGFTRVREIAPVAAPPEEPEEETKHADG